MKLSLISTLLLALATSTAWGQGNIQTKKDVEYAVHDGVSLKGDLYQPVSAGAHPAVLLIHGGGWLAGSKAGDGNTWGPYLAERGYVAFSIDYRLSTATQPTWPQALLDCKAAVQYLRGDAAALGVDPERIGVEGDSAGGNLAALVALTQDLPDFANRYPTDTYASVSTKVKLAMPIYGVFDMMAAYAQPNLTKMLAQFMGGGPGQHPGGYFGSSPLDYLREAATSLGDVATPNAGAKIPWFLAWGTADKVVWPPGQSVTFVQALRDAGAQVTAVQVPNAGHGWFSTTPVTGSKAEPDCNEGTPGRYSCSGATPNDFIVAQLMEFLAHNL